MASFLVIVNEDEAEHAAQPPGETARLIDARTAYAETLRRSRKLVDTGRLRPSKEGKRVRRGAGEVVAEDGPLAQGGTALGGYYWVEARDLPEALALANDCPTLPADVLEVRPVMKGDVPESKDAKPGKVFAYAVLGRSPSEEGWVQVMDRIDEATHGCFPRTSFLGGLRLESPGRGRQVVTRGERRATLDAPFLEGREVIGGLFFLRMPHLDEAVRWAGVTAFVEHGALEIRELWRT